MIVLKVRNHQSSKKIKKFGKGIAMVHIAKLRFLIKVIGLLSK